MSVVPGENSQDIGREGLYKAKRWLELSTRVASSWTHEDGPLAELLGFYWPYGGRSFTFDLGGIFRGDDLAEQSFLVEVKNCKNEGNLPTHYRDFLAKCYVAFQARPDRCAHFVWLSWAPFQAKNWDVHTSVEKVRSSLLHEANRERVFGVQDLEEAREQLDAETLVAVSERLWLLTLSAKQERLVLTKRHYLEVVKMITDEAV
jgi:hypothetical protein